MKVENRVLAESMYSQDKIQPGDTVPISTFGELGEVAGAFDRVIEGNAWDGFAEMTVEGRTLLLTITMAYDMGNCTPQKRCGCSVCPDCNGIPF